jgi:hypothetical protein
MVISLMTLVLLTMVGTYFLAQTKTETQIAGHDQRAAQALYNAEAGFGEVLARMADAADTANYIGEPVGTGTPGWGRYVVLAGGNASGDPDYTLTEGDGLDNDGDGTADEGGERYPEVATKQAGDMIDYPWVSVRYMLNSTNQIILFGDHDADLVTAPQFNLVSGFPVILVTAEGTQGSASRRIEIEAVKRPFEMVQTAVYSESDEFKFNGTQFKVSGQDWDPVTGAVTGNPEVPGITTTGDPANIADGLTVWQQNNVEGTGAEPSVTPTAVDLDLEALAAEFATRAEYVIPTGTYSNVTWGSYDDYTIVHCTGDLHISGGMTGGGVLIVDQDFSCSGSLTWYGVVVVLGDMSFTGGGSDILIYGATLVQGTASGETVGGNADLLYSSEALNRLTSLSPYLVMNWREIN